MSFQYDLIAIGGGSVGVAAARGASKYGARCTVVEFDRLGGTCVNRGCVPKKIIWNAAHIAHTVGDVAGYGFNVEAKGFDWGKLVADREAYIARLNKIYESNLEKENVEIIRGFGSLVDKNTVKVGGNSYTAERIILAPGIAPDVPGAILASPPTVFLN